MAFLRLEGASLLAKAPGKLKLPGRQGELSLSLWLLPVLKLENRSNDGKKKDGWLGYEFEK